MTSRNYFLLYDDYYCRLFKNKHGSKRTNPGGFKLQLDMLVIENWYGDFKRNEDPFLDPIFFVKNVDLIRDFLRRFKSETLIDISVNSELVDAEYEKIHDIVKVMGE